MTANPCNCDDSKEWQLRALRAEAKARSLELQLAIERKGLESLRQAILQLIESQDLSEQLVPGMHGETVFASGSAEPIFGTEGVIGRVLLSPENEG